MNIIIAVGKELLGMFLADSRLTLAILVLVAVVDGVLSFRGGPLLGGAVLLAGCLAILVEAAYREAGKRKHP